MRKLTPREYTLSALLAVVAVLLFYYNRDAGLGVGRSAGPAGDELALGEAPVVLLDRLAGQYENYDPAGRDLFKYYTPPPPVRKIERPPPPPQERPRPQVQVDRPPPRPVVTAPTPPSIDFVYLGYLGPKEDKIAVFEDGQELLLARTGDVVKDRFRLVDFGYETVLMGYVDERFKDQTSELRQKPGAGGGRGSRGRR